MKILIIEDEYNLADVIASTLEKENYQAEIETDGEVGCYKANMGIYDLIILDVMLPNMNGFEILKDIRKNNIKSKVIMLTAKATLEDKLDGLENGANDYVTKPFHIEELVARVNIQLKGTESIGKKDVLEYGDLELNLTTSKLKCTSSSECVELVCKEFMLMEYFINNSNQVLSKEQIYNRVWGIENESESNNLEVYISFLRKKIKAIDSKVSIKALRGLGYRLEYMDE